MISVTSDGVGGAGPLQHREVAQGCECRAQYTHAEDRAQHGRRGHRQSPTAGRPRLPAEWRRRARPPSASPRPRTADSVRAACARRCWRARSTKVLRAARGAPARRRACRPRSRSPRGCRPRRCRPEYRPACASDSFSSWVSMCARKMPNSGAVALRIAAMPPVARDCPQTIRTKRQHRVEGGEEDEQAPLRQRRRQAVAERQDDERAGHERPVMVRRAASVKAGSSGCSDGDEEIGAAPEHRLQRNQAPFDGAQPQRRLAQVASPFLHGAMFGRSGRAAATASRARARVATGWP